MTLKGKVAFVKRASPGIGGATAERLARGSGPYFCNEPVQFHRSARVGDPVS